METQGLEHGTVSDEVLLLMMRTQSTRAVTQSEDSLAAQLAWQDG